MEKLKPWVVKLWNVNLKWIFLGLAGWIFLSGNSDYGALLTTIIFGIIALLFSKDEKTNYMLYPHFSWDRIHEAKKKSDSYDEKLGKLTNKTDLKSKRAREKYSLLYYVYMNEYLFMLKANSEIVNGKKNGNEIWDEYRKGEWFDVSDGEISGKLKEKLDKYEKFNI